MEQTCLIQNFSILLIDSKRDRTDLLNWIYLEENYRIFYSILFFINKMIKSDVPNESKRFRWKRSLKDN